MVGSSGYLANINPLYVSGFLFFCCLGHAYMKISFKNRMLKEGTVLGLFHPYCNHGGGGERVLWLLIFALLNQREISNRLTIKVYTGDIGINRETLIANAEKHFGIKINPNSADRLQFVYIKSRTLLEPKWYPFVTMLFQSLGTLLVAAECLLYCTPDIFCDTTGAAFSYPLARLLGCKVVAYVHYPIISEDMLRLVRERRPTYNNDKTIATSVSISKLKYYYYKMFAYLYGQVGRCAGLVMCNSSWTTGHISSLWNLQESENVASTLKTSLPAPYMKRLVKIYPPCNTTKWSALSCHNDRKPLILSVGQFRPEKDHRLQLRAFSRFCKSPMGSKFPDVRLVLLGSARNATDEALVSSLREYAKDLGIEDKTDFVVNAPYSSLQRYLQESAIGLHTMWNEHFGISVVEMMAAGLLVIAHKSAGPLMDIVVPCAGHSIGFLATTEEEYAEEMGNALELAFTPSRADSYEQMLSLAGTSIQRFADEVFCSNICREFYVLLQ